MSRGLLIMCLTAQFVGWAGTGVYSSDQGPRSESDPETVDKRAEIVLFNNGDPDTSSGSDLGSYSLADDFEVSVSATATGAYFEMGDYNGFPANWDGVLRWWICTDDLGLPGTVLAKGVGVDVGWSHHGAYLSWEIYSIYFNFGQSIPMTAGTRYWLVLHMNRTWGYHVGLVWLRTPTGNYSSAAADLVSFGDWDTWSGVEHAFSIIASTDSYLFTDGFELGDTSIWSSTAP